MDTVTWFREVTGGDSVNAAAKAAGINQPTLARQINAGTISPENVVAVARAYNADPIEGLIIAGLITEAEVRAHGADVLLAALDDRIIANEVWRRMADGHNHPEFGN